MTAEPMEKGLAEDIENEVRHFLIQNNNRLQPDANIVFFILPCTHTVYHYSSSLALETYFICGSTAHVSFLKHEEVLFLDVFFG